MRTNPYPENDPSDFSMLTNPKLKLGDTVIVWDESQGGEWAQARVVDARFNRYRKLWEYSAVVEFVDDQSQTMVFGDSNIEHTITDMKMVVKEWYCFSDEDLQLNVTTIRVTQQKGAWFWKHEVQKDIFIDKTPEYVIIKNL